MKERFFCRHAWVFAATLFLLPTSSFAQTARDQLKQEIARLEKALASKPDAGDFWEDAKPDLKQSLARARESLAAGRIYLAIADLESASTRFGGLVAATGNPAIVKSGLKAFDEEWRRGDQELKALETRYSAEEWTETPAAVRGIAETDWIETRTLYQASRPYAEATSAEYGLIYLGQAQASAEFALFSRLLRFPALAPQPPVRSVAAEIQRLEDRVLAAYKPPLSIDRHTDFIRISAALKVAKELDVAHLDYGALYKYLDAAEMFGLLTAPPGNVNRSVALHKEAAQIRTRLATNAADHSLAQFFLERAERSLKTPDAIHLQAAQVRLEQVIPAYFAAIGKPEARAVVAGNPITITLVRWPYT